MYYHFQFSSGDGSPITQSKKKQFEKAFYEGDVDKARELVSALEYFPGPKNWEKIYDKLRIVKLLLSNGIVRIDNQRKVLEKVDYKEGEFDVFLIPGSALIWHLVVNVPAVQNWGNKTIERGMKPIHIISSLPDVSSGIVQIILENGNDGVNTKTSLKLTPLMLAAFSGNFEVVKFLVERGARINDISSVSLEIVGHYLLALLFSGKQFTSVNTEVHFSALVSAITGKNIDVVKYLISKGADVNNHGECWVALFPPAIAGQKEISDILLRSGIDVNCKDIMGSTALHTLAVKGYINMAKIFLKNGARLNATDSLGWTSLHVASFYSQNGGKDMIELLVKSGSDIKSLTDGGYSSLILVEAGYNIDLVTFLLNNVGNLFPTGHMDVPEKGSNKDHTDIVDFVIQQGAPLNQQDNVFGWTALHWAAAAGDLDVVKLLVQNGAKTDLKSKKGYDPLETAKLFRRTKIAEYLKTAKQ